MTFECTRRFTLRHVSTLQISELARRTGFPPTTLRYYETLGLLPAPGRTPAGYRVYDERAEERLAFIARAKAMGLGLDDIAGLVALWADGPCGEVQDHLRRLLDDKIDEVATRRRELDAFAHQLEHLRATLATDAPGERCGPGCGCDLAVDSPGDAPAKVTFGARRG